MGAWYIPVQSKELSDWNPRAISLATGAQAVQRVEPTREKQTINGVDVLPLTDAGSGAGPYQTATRSITHDGETATAEYVLSSIPLADRKAAMKAAITAKRWAVETAGITVSGSAIATDAATQAKLSGALQLVQDDDTVVIDWKGADGTWVQLNAAAVTAIAVAVGTHVQACFTREKELHAAVDNVATGAVLDLIDIEAGSTNGSGAWPS